MGAGTAWRRVTGAQFRFPFFTSNASGLGRAVGMAAAAGVELRAAHSRWRPEVRWIWFNQPIEQYLENRQARGRVHFVLGITPARR